MKALTVCQPWAWAICCGAKTVENRTQLFKHRGDLAIHAGGRWSERGAHHPLLADLYLRERRRQGWSPLGSREDYIASYVEQGIPRLVDTQFGAVLCVVDLVDVHTAHDGCCDSPWAEEQYVEHGGRVRLSITHLVLEDVRPLPLPVPCRGWQSIWTLPDDIEVEVRDGLAA